ncbi:MAG TPA: hypothetical protein VLK85_34255 [Ramlibacter sp.]|nr:hypothetical protein [Ramlibacter sp.]
MHRITSAVPALKRSISRCHWYNGVTAEQQVGWHAVAFSQSRERQCWSSTAHNRTPKGATETYDNCNCAVRALALLNCSLHDGSLSACDTKVTRMDGIR